MLITTNFVDNGETVKTFDLTKTFLLEHVTHDYNTITVNQQSNEFVQDKTIFEHDHLISMFEENILPLRKEVNYGNV